MNSRNNSRIVGLLLCLVTALAAPQGALAAYTPACTAITNQAHVAYKVSGADQTPADSNTDTITVGNRVNVTVATTNASPGPSVVPNQVDVLLTFTIKNDGNASQAYHLVPGELASGSTPSVFGNQTVTDSFNAFSFVAGDETGAALAGNMTPVVASGATYTVTVKATMPAPSLTDGWSAVYSMRAESYKVDGATIEANAANSSINGGACTAAVVLGDVAGTDDRVPGASPDGSHSARSAYHVVLNSLTITKTSAPYWDPINLFVGPKAIPGAIMEYTVVINNPGGNAATALTITDTLNAALAAVTGAWSSTNGGPVSCTDRAVHKKTGDAAWTCLDGTGVGGIGWTGNALSAIVPTLNSASTATILFQATIN